jgi:BirA family biotin operon repressor/biotin-[acetyl-CoA-carboxylase] ligase
VSENLVANRVLESCGSTNDIARGLGEEGVPHGTWVSARAQEKGRGRLGREWQSQEGNLFLSLIARIEDKALWTWVPLATAIGTARALRTWNGMGIDIRIKWPNDLWIGRAKLGGILCEAVGNRAGSFIVIGLGLNCVHAPEGLDQLTASLSGAAQAITADQVRPAVINGILSALDELAREGTSGLVRDYERWAAFPPGTEIEWSQGSGKVRGLGPAGELVVETLSGLQRLYAEDTRQIR